MPISKAESTSFIWNKIKTQWQRVWDGDLEGRNLYPIQQEVGVGRSLGK